MIPLRSGDVLSALAARRRAPVPVTDNRMPPVLKEVSGMHGESVPSSAPGRAVDTHAIDVYCYAARRGGIQSVVDVALDLSLDQAEVSYWIEQLVDMGLIVADSGAAGGYAPVDLD